MWFHFFPSFLANYAAYQDSLLTKMLIYILIDLRLSRMFPTSPDHAPDPQNDTRLSHTYLKALFV